MLPLEIERYLRPSGRPRELVVGIVVGLLSLVFLYLGTYVLVVGIARGLLAAPLFERGKLEFVLVPAILLALGVPGAWVAFRLLAARRRRDGGLFAPLVLRLAGALMLAVAILAVAESPREPRRWSDAVTLGTAAIASWVLAGRRARPVGAEQEPGPPGSKPIE